MKTKLNFDVSFEEDNYLKTTVTSKIIKSHFIVTEQKTLKIKALFTYIGGNIRWVA